MKELKIVSHRVFQVSVNIPFTHHIMISKVYKVRNYGDLIIPVLLYTIANLLVGFWGKRVFETFKAMGVNFSGGEDYSKHIKELDYDATTNFIWNNLTRVTSEKIDRDVVVVLIELQEKYMEANDDVFSETNMYSLKSLMSHKGYGYLNDSHISDFFDAMRILGEHQ